MKVFLSELAELKLLKLSEYLLENWNLQTRDKFIKRLTNKVEQISVHPESCPVSNEFKGLFKCVVTKQTTFYFRILRGKNEIEIITIFDTRQNPEKLRNELK